MLHPFAVQKHRISKRGGIQRLIRKPSARTFSGKFFDHSSYWMIWLRFERSGLTDRSLNELIKRFYSSYYNSKDNNLDQSCRFSFHHCVSNVKHTSLSSNSVLRRWKCDGYFLKDGSTAARHSTWQQHIPKRTTTGNHNNKLKPTGILRLPVS